MEGLGDVIGALAITPLLGGAIAIRPQEVTSVGEQNASTSYDPGEVNNAVANDSFAGSALAGWFEEFHPEFLEDLTVASGYAQATLLVGGVGGSHWYNDRIGYLARQVCIGDFDIALELQVFDADFAGLPPATNDARLAGLAAHDPDRTELNYVHRAFGRAPGMEIGGDIIVDESKSNVDDVSDWHTYTHPHPSDCRGWVRIRRVGSTFTSWSSADGITWGSEASVVRTDLPELLHVGPMIYAAATDADVGARFYQLINYREDQPAMSHTTATQVDILEYEFENTQMPTPPSAVWIGLSTTTPTAAGGNFTEPSGNSYARVDATALFGAISSGGGISSIANDAEVAFPAATGSWGTITHFGKFAASSGGTPTRTAALDASRAISSADVFRFLAGEMVFTEG